MNWWAAALCLVIAGAALAVAFRPGTDHVVRGTVTIVDDGDGTVESAYPPGSCSAQGVHQGVAVGGQVTVFDGDDHVLAVGKLGRGRDDLGIPQSLREIDAQLGRTVHSCQWAFTVTVPDRPFYEVQVEGELGVLRLARRDLKRDQWKVAVGLA